jgi:MmyB-like transcription regulator ligand binding domain
MIDRLAELPVLVYDPGWDLVAMNDLHAAATTYPEDERLAGLIAELRVTSPRFDAMWRERPVAALAEVVLGGVPG